jgi:hypothetical protein
VHVSLFVHVQGVHLRKEAIIFGGLINLVLPVSELPIDLDQPKDETLS